jgi:hypothetical protein
MVSAQDRITNTDRAEGLMKHDRTANRSGVAIAALAACAISLGLMSTAGCGTGSAPAAKGFVAILPGPVQVGTGGSLQIFAEATPSQVTWAITAGSGCSGSGCGTLSNPTATSVDYLGPTSISGSSATFTLTATSTADSSLSASQTYTIFPVAVQITGPANTTVQPLTSAAFTAVVNGDPTTEGVTWSVSGSNCTGAGVGYTNCGSLTHATSTSVTYTAPAAPALETVILTATSNAFPGTSASFAMTIPKLTVYGYTPTTLPAAIVGQPYRATVTVTGNTPPYTFTASNVPSWATFTPSPSTGSFTITGTPTSGTQGSTQVLLTTSDTSTPVATGSQYFILTVYPAAATGNNLLTGSYTFYASGWLDGSLPTTAFQGIAYIGSFTADGNGNITGGELDENNFQTGLSSFTNLSGTYNIQYAVSGSVPQAGFQTGYITLLLGGSQHPITLAVSFRGIVHQPIVPPATTYNLATDVASFADFIEFDDTTGDGASVSGSSSGQRMSGTIAQQNSAVLNQTASPLQGSFAFGMMGNTPQSTTSITSSANCFITAPPSCGPISLAGMFNVASTGVVSGGEEDIMIATNYYPAVAGSLAGSFAGGGASDSYGRMTASIANASASTTGIFSGWPSDYIVYAVDSQHFYIMSSDSYQKFSTLIGTATAQLPAINTLPIDVTTPLALLSSVVSTQYFTSSGGGPNGKVRAQVQVLTATLNASGCSSGQYGLQGPQYQNLSGTSTTATVGSIGNYCNTLGANGRLVPASNSTGEAEPIIYLTNTNTGYGTQWNGGSGPGLWLVIDRTSASLNGGSYSDSMVSPTSIQAPMEVGIINLPSTGAPYNSKNVTLTGTIFTQFSQTLEPYSADTGALLYTGPITGNINNNEAAYADNGVNYDGVLIKNAFTLSPANTFQGCASGYGFVVTSTSFMCIDTLDQFSTPHLFQQ